MIFNEHKLSVYEWRDFPEHMRDGLLRYVNQGIPPGGFMEAVLCNDLRMAIGRADGINALELYKIVMFLNMNIPHNCWGSREQYEEWIKLGGLDEILGTRGKTDDNDIDKNFRD